LTSSSGDPGPRFPSSAGRVTSGLETELSLLSHRYAAAVDRRDASALAELFLPDGRLTVSRGGRETDRFEGRAAMPGVIDLVSGFDCTQHAVLAHDFELAEGTARGDVAVEAHHVRIAADGSDGTDVVLHGRYLDEYGLDGGGRWRISTRLLRVDWSETRRIDGTGIRAAARRPPATAADDRQAIEDLVMRYCRAVDRLDPEGIRACYHAEGRDRHTGFDGPREEFVSWVTEGLARFDGTMHLVGNHLSEVEGVTAHAETYGLAFHWGTPADDERLNFVSAFRYADRLERRDGEWRIIARVAIREWTRILSAPEWRPPEGKAPTGSRDADDVSYAVGFRRG
jgi:ketosteroid isomerase-like protein